MRRSSLAIGGSLTRRDLDEIAAIAGRALAWSTERLAREVEAAVVELEGRNLMRLD
jgi:glycerol-3-phosphate dehydrogenase